MKILVLCIAALALIALELRSAKRDIDRIKRSVDILAERGGAEGLSGAFSVLRT